LLLSYHIDSATETGRSFPYHYENDIKMTGSVTTTDRLLGLRTLGGMSTALFGEQQVKSFDHLLDAGRFPYWSMSAFVIPRSHFEKDGVTVAAQDVSSLNTLPHFPCSSTL
jgi:hypothetical protein